MKTYFMKNGSVEKILKLKTEKISHEERNRE
jgi:hypothetical protein